MLACKLKTLTAAGAVGLLLAVGSTGASAQSAYCDGVARTMRPGMPTAARSSAARSAAR
jgi:hypothetical protein